MKDYLSSLYNLLVFLQCSTTLSIAALSTPLNLRMKSPTTAVTTTFSGISSAALNWDTSSVGTGELVFSTAMTGYTQTLTDPSFKGQILVLTYPLVGNYGISKNDSTMCAPYLAPDSHESHSIQVAGLVVSSLIDGTDHNNVHTLRQWLTEQGIPVISGIDTRYKSVFFFCFHTRIG